MGRTTLIKRVNGVLTVTGLVAVAYHMVMVQWQLQGSTPHYLTHVFFALTIAFLAVISEALEAGDSGWNRTKLVVAVVSLLGAWIALGYFAVNAIHLELVQPYINDTDFWIGALAVSVLIIATWFHWGPIITCLTIIGIAYFFYGHLIPGPMGHPEYEPDFVMSYLGVSLTLGMFGPIIQVSANVIFLFVVFGALFRYTGVLPLFLELGKWVGNLVRGGAAFPAVIGSGFVGTVTGAAIANVILTGSVTIPTMKRTGFRSEHAAAIEAVASTGGQIMPPIMGSAAFLMATFLEVPYIEVMKKAVVPALLFYVGVGVGVFFLIRAAGLRPPRELVDGRLVLKTLPVFLIPMTVVIWLLLQFYSPGYAAFYGILVMVAVAVLQKETRPTAGEWVEGFNKAAQIGAQLALILALVGILAQVSVTTNLATKLSQTVTEVVGNELLPILIISAIAGILLGMELPTPVAYVIMFVTVVPIMIDAGVEVFAANFFAFYFAILSTLTPPVALSVLAASRIAGCGFLAACKHSIRLSLVGYLLPFVMIFSPSILGFPYGIGSTGAAAIGVFVLATVAGGASLYGYLFRRLGFFDRAVNGAAAFAGLAFVFNHEWEVLFLFFGLLALGVARPLLAWLRERRVAEAAASATIAARSVQTEETNARTGID